MTSSLDADRMAMKQPLADMFEMKAAEHETRLRRANHHGHSTITSMRTATHSSGSKHAGEYKLHLGEMASTNKREVGNTLQH